MTNKKNLFFVLLPTFLLVCLGYLLKTKYPFFYQRLYKENTKVGNVFNVALNEVSDSGELGNAQILDINDRVVVKMRLEGFPENVQQTAFFMSGSCESLDKVKLYIAPLVNGMSTTTYYELTIKELKNMRPMAIVVTKSIDDPSKTYSCGDWKQ